MRMVDIIEKKVQGSSLSQEEISFFIRGYVEGSIPDYQASALTMAILFQGMNKEEIATLTDEMMHSGDVLDLSSIAGIKADKHSTGGVGDKTSLAVGPLVAACGAKIAKMSGRGLGHTGGTLDKLESIPGMNVYLNEETFIKQVNDIGIAIIGQTKSLDPADKKLYALRDVTATVDSIPLIASSIMSKKLASGSNTILLDVKFGSGAFMKNLDSARELAQTMVDIGTSLGRDTRAILTDMNQPLGRAVGNIIEVKEAIATLKGKGPSDFVELVTEAGAIILEQAKIVNNHEEGKRRIQKAIEDGSGLTKLAQMVKAQGGDESYIYHPEKFQKAKYDIRIRAKDDGYVQKIDSLQIGLCAMKAGAGRETMNDVIDMASGIYLDKKVGDKVEKGEVLATLYTNKENGAEIASEIENAFFLVEKPFETHSIIYEYIYEDPIANC